MSGPSQPSGASSKKFAEWVLTADGPAEVWVWGIIAELEASLSELGDPHQINWMPLGNHVDKYGTGGEDTDLITADVEARSINALAPTIMPTIIPDNQRDRIAE